MRNIKLTIEYDGTNYAGWQRQINAITVEQRVEEAIEKLTSRHCAVIGASRTDSGVHARAYVCNFLTDSVIPEYKFKGALNNFLPEDIVVKECGEVSLDFHARFCSKGKRYIYTVFNGDQRLALSRNYAYYYHRKLDILKMKKAAKYLIGTHDFAAFKNKGSNPYNSIRTITELDVEKKGQFITFTVTGNAFLYNMVRIIVGTLLDVGCGRFEVDYVKTILESKDRSKAGKSAPALGLVLDEVFY